MSIEELSDGKKLVVARALGDRARVVELLRSALLRCGRITYAATALGLSSSNLHKLLHEYPEAREGLALPPVGRPRKLSPAMPVPPKG